MSIFVTGIVSALAAGALASAKEVASQAVADAYDGLKTLLQDVYHLTSLKLLEKNPESEGFRSALKEEISGTDATEDESVAELLQQLIEAIEADEMTQQALQDGGIEIGDILAGKNVLLKGLGAERGIKVGNIEGGEDVVIENVEAGKQGK